MKSRKSKLPNINVIVLGASGSGKTVYLSVLYNKYRARGTNPFYLKTDDDTHQKLMGSYSRIISSNREIWPRGTTLLDDLSFDCYVDEHLACQFNYLEYRGGALFDEIDQSEPGSQGHRTLVNTIKEKIKNKTTILIGMLDGERVQSILDQEEEGYVNLMRKDLSNMLELMKDAQVPIHFVVSKWDYIRDCAKEHNLAQNSLNDEYKSLDAVIFDKVKKELLGMGYFRRFVENRSDRPEKIRLLSLSAVGQNFAKYVPQADGGSIMVKTLEKREPEPFMIEVLLAIALKDSIDLQQKRTRRIIRLTEAFSFLMSVFRLLSVSQVSERSVPGFQGVTQGLADRVWTVLENSKLKWLRRIKWSIEGLILILVWSILIDTEVIKIENLPSIWTDNSPWIGRVAIIVIMLLCILADLILAGQFNPKEVKKREQSLITLATSFRMEIEKLNNRFQSNILNKN